MKHFLHLALTPKVLEAQRATYGRSYSPGPAPERDALGPRELAFIAARDSFYMASVGEDGWPYVQHRGGEPGFLHALDTHTLAFADLQGNRQLVTVGNLASDDRVALILVDYPNRARLKLLARATVLAPSEAPELDALLAPRTPRAVVERILRLDVCGLDWNCPQHITPRYTRAEVEAYLARPSDGG